MLGHQDHQDRSLGALDHDEKSLGALESLFEKLFHLNRKLEIQVRFLLASFLRYFKSPLLSFFNTDVHILHYA